VLEGLRGLLTADFELVGQVTNGRELVEECRRLKPDVAIADISMPLLNGIEAARQIRDEGLATRIVFLTMHPDMTYATRALETGASGYVLKHAAPEELVAAIHEALRGGVYLSLAMRTPAMDELLAARKSGASATIELTPRQREVLQLLAEGKSAKEIGAILNISARTAETHKYKMMDDLGVKTSAELVQYAIRHGLVSL
jgi:DNA-binding NarL/FixJ family response regulator